jgi:hypothetical protein
LKVRSDGANAAIAAQLIFDIKTIALNAEIYCRALARPYINSEKIQDVDELFDAVCQLETAATQLRQFAESQYD